MRFKESVKRDIGRVFLNKEEHASVLDVTYNGEYYNIPVIIDHGGEKDRKQSANDHAAGLFIADLTVYISFYDLGIVPRKNTPITVDGETYNIVTTANDEGVITLDLEVVDE